MNQSNDYDLTPPTIPGPVPRQPMTPLLEDFVQAAKDDGHPYHTLALALLMAYDQAARGKGRERHANSLPFHLQPMQSASKMLGSADGLRFQVIKKIRESKNMGMHPQQKELLGAIVYTAGIYVYNEENENA